MAACLTGRGDSCRSDESSTGGAECSFAHETEARTDEMDEGGARTERSHCRNRVGSPKWAPGESVEMLADIDHSRMSLGKSLARCPVTSASGFRPCISGPSTELHTADALRSGLSATTTLQESDAEFATVRVRLPSGNRGPSEVQRLPA